MGGGVSSKESKSYHHLTPIPPMTTRLSSKGQIIIPKAIRAARSWRPGQQFEVVETGEGVLLRPCQGFPRTELDEVAGCLAYDGPPVSVEEMNGAVALKRRMEKAHE